MRKIIAHAQAKKQPQAVASLAIYNKLHNYYLYLRSTARMSTPVVTDKWAGNFDCSGPCRRKRLVGSEFSKSVCMMMSCSCS